MDRLRCFSCSNAPSLESLPARVQTPSPCSLRTASPGHAFDLVTPSGLKFFAEVSQRIYGRQVPDIGENTRLGETLKVRLSHKRKRARPRDSSRREADRSAERATLAGLARPSLSAQPTGLSSSQKAFSDPLQLGLPLASAAALLLWPCCRLYVLPIVPAVPLLSWLARLATCCGVAARSARSIAARLKRFQTALRVAPPEFQSAGACLTLLLVT